MNSQVQSAAAAEVPAAALEQFSHVLQTMAQARPFAKPVHQNRLFSLAQKILKLPGGAQALFAHAPAFDSAGLFWGSDWENPGHLQPALTRGSLLADGQLPALESLSELRMLAIALGQSDYEGFDADQARDFLEDTLARNLDLMFPAATEASREQAPPMAGAVQYLFEFIAAKLGSGGILKSMVEEADRVLLQRPIMTDRVISILRAAKQALPEQAQAQEDDIIRQARALIAASEAPSTLANENLDAVGYAAALNALDASSLAYEAKTFGASMDITGLVAPLHAVLLRHLVQSAPEHLADALALKRIGRTCLDVYPAIVNELIVHAVYPETAQCIYGLSRMLERGIMFFQPVVPGLRRLMLLPVLPEVAQALQTASGHAEPLPASTLLVAGSLSVLGQPRGVDQGHNPTCQAARAISLWSQNDVGYLLELIARAARDADVVMPFEGTILHSRDLSFGLAQTLHTELDPVSLVLTSHLDRLYMEMSRRTIGRGEDGHKWVNPELHGWWVHRGFAALIDAATGAIHEFDVFIRQFHAAYHPDYNGGRDLVYAQPCGVVVTNHSGEFVGWHAVSIQRVGYDPDGVCRVYFFNPNRDKGQNWGQGLVTTTSDHGEQEGESSLPFEQFASRLYVYHYKRGELGDSSAVPAVSVANIREAVQSSWAKARNWLPEEPQGE